MDAQCIQNGINDVLSVDFRSQDSRDVFENKKLGPVMVQHLYIAFKKIIPGIIAHALVVLGPSQAGIGLAGRAADNQINRLSGYHLIQTFYHIRPGDIHLQHRFLRVLIPIITHSGPQSLAGHRVNLHMGCGPEPLPVKAFA